MVYETVKYLRKGKIAYITLDRPESLNAINRQLEADLRAAFNRYDLDDKAWVAILSGSGRSFCSGADIKERFVGMSKDEKLRWSMSGGPDSFLDKCANWKPVIAAIHGYALGWGISIALECDLITASEEALFGITETKRSFTAGRVWGKAHTFMPSKVTTELLLTGEPMSSSSLYNMGLINRVAPIGQHLKAAEELAKKLVECPPLAVRAGVRITRWAWTRWIDDTDLYYQPIKLHLTKDFVESSNAFLERRKPKYRGM